MTDIRVGSVVISLRGHDKGRIMAVVAIEGNYASVCDGRKRTVQKPKTKKLSHLSLLSDETLGCFESDAEMTNKRLWKALEPYRINVKP